MKPFGQPQSNTPKTLRKDQRILKRRDFQRVFECGKSFRAKWLTVRVEKNGESGKAKIGLVISRKTEAKATRRNLWKRRVRDVFRRMASRINPGVLIVIQARPNKGLPEQKEIAQEIETLLAESGVLKRS